MVRPEAPGESSVLEGMVEVKASVVAVDVVPDPAVALGLDVRPDADARGLVRGLGRTGRCSALGGLRRERPVRGKVARDGLRGWPCGRRRGSRPFPVLLGVCEGGNGPDQEGPEESEGTGKAVHGSLRVPVSQESFQQPAPSSLCGDVIAR